MARCWRSSRRKASGRRRASKPRESRHLAIAVDDFDAEVVAALAAQGVELQKPLQIKGNRLQFFTDSDGET